MSRSYEAGPCPWSAGGIPDVGTPAAAAAVAEAEEVEEEGVVMNDKPGGQG